MDKVRSAVANLKNSKKRRIINTIYILLIFAVAGFETVFLSNILNGKMDNAIEVFASMRIENQEILNDNLYDIKNLYSYEVPKAEMLEKNEVPMVALTFDDGPHPVNTIRILNILSKYNAKATFFMIGENVENNKWIPKKVIEQGSEIGTHTFNHPNLNSLDENSIIYQLSESSKIIEENSGTSVKLFRPPYGNSNELTRSIAKSQNKAIILWNIDTEDWKSKDAKKVSEHVLNNVKDGDIVLMHDIYSSTADASEVIVEELTKRGYKLVTISELFRNRGINLNYGEKYYNCI